MTVAAKSTEGIVSLVKRYVIDSEEMGFTFDGSVLNSVRFEAEIGPFVLIPTHEVEVLNVGATFDTTDSEAFSIPKTADCTRCVV